jgi:prevent-host-death family protein
MSDVSSRDLRNRTAEVLRRVEAGEHLRVTVNRRAVAELIPLTRPVWTLGASWQRLLVEGRADGDVMRDLARIRQQIIEPQ